MKVWFVDFQVRLLIQGCCTYTSLICGNDFPKLQNAFTPLLVNNIKMSSESVSKAVTWLSVATKTLTSLVTCYGRTYQSRKQCLCSFFDIRPGTSVKRLALHFHYKMQKNEEFKKNIKAKEVITTFCKLLSALDVESVPTAEVFRRAKFNRIDVVSDSFLSSPKPYFPQHT